MTGLKPLQAPERIRLYFEVTQDIVRRKFSGCVVALTRIAKRSPKDEVPPTATRAPLSAPWIAA
ncbi:unannotated protein [freshwater metagenome]|uniref:Unannotated protein n=1 Tax=freshwater metagenome TaxID=449393 RepID=A0A6J7G107_9ZZZZ